MISIIIASYNEPETIGKAMEAFLSQVPEDYELIISAPDEKTLNEAKKHRNKRTFFIKDEGKGKPSVLNLALKKAKGEVIVLSDGDVFVDKGSVESLVSMFGDSKIGAVSGRVISLNSHKKLFGFWAYVLTESFHRLRLKKAKQKKSIVCSGYLYAIKKNLIKGLPSNALADDAFISGTVLNKGFKTAYAPNARVFVKYPLNLIDWISQKKRTAARYYQYPGFSTEMKVSSFRDELVLGFYSFGFVKNFRELFWLLFLFIMRFYVWFRIFFDFRLWKSSLGKTWRRVESTK